VEGFGVGDGAARLGDVEGEGEEGCKLGRKSLGRRNTDFGAGVGGDRPGGLARDGRADDVADGERLEPL